MLSDREEALLLETPQALVDLSAEHHSRGFLQLLINSQSQNMINGRIWKQPEYFAEASNSARTIDGVIVSCDAEDLYLEEQMELLLHQHAVEEPVVLLSV